LYTDYRDEAIGEDATHGGVGLEVFERAHTAKCLDMYFATWRGRPTGLPQPRNVLEM
jgi:hypothetical protein